LVSKINTKILIHIQVCLYPDEMDDLLLENTFTVCVFRLMPSENFFPLLVHVYIIASFFLNALIHVRMLGFTKPTCWAGIQ